MFAMWLGHPVLDYSFLQDVQASNERSSKDHVKKSIWSYSPMLPNNPSNYLTCMYLWDLGDFQPALGIAINLVLVRHKLWVFLLVVWYVQYTKTVFRYIYLAFLDCDHVQLFLEKHTCRGQVPMKHCSIKHHHHYCHAVSGVILHPSLICLATKYSPKSYRCIYTTFNSAYIKATSLTCFSQRMKSCKSNVQSNSSKDPIGVTNRLLYL